MFYNPQTEHQPHQEEISYYTTCYDSVGIQIGNSKFTMFREYDDYNIFRCNVQNCRAKCQTTPLNDVISVIGTHNHVERHASVRIRQKLRTKIIELSRRRPNDRPHDIVNDAIVEFDLHFRKEDEAAAKRAINRDRLSTRPKLPTDVDDAFTAMERAKEDKSLKGADMIKDLDRKNGIALFYSDRNLSLLNGHTPKQLFGDGTFTYSANYWTQMYTFHIHRGGFYVPVCYFLLPNMLTITYNAMYEMLINACNGLGFSIDIDFFYS